MKRLIATAAALAALLAAQGAYAAAPGRLTYQGTLRKDGRLFSGTAAMEFRLTDSAGALEYWTSGSTDVVVSTGLFRYPLGTPNEAQFASIVWQDVTPYVQVKLDGAWLPPEPLYSSAYAQHALTAESSTNTFTINGGNLRLNGTADTNGVVFPDGTVQYGAPGWRVSTNNLYSTFSGRAGVGGVLIPAYAMDVQAGLGDTHAQVWRNSAGSIISSMTVGGVLYADGSQLRNLPTAADNLGNHTATQALNLAGFALNSAGAITASGQFTTASSATVASALGLGAARLRLAQNVELSSAAADDEGGVLVSTHIFLASGAKYYGDGSALTGVSGSDNLGDHSATRTLNMWGFQIHNSGHIGASSATLTNPLGLAAPRLGLAPGVELSSAAAAEQGGVRVSSHVYLAPGARLYGEAAVLTLQHETEPALTVSSGLVVSAGNIGVGVAFPQESLHVSGGLRLGTTPNAAAGTLRYTGAAFEGYTGGTWVALNGSYNIDSSALWAVTTDTVYTVGSSSGVAIGTTDAGVSKLRVTGDGNTSAANALIAESQDLSPLLTVRNDGRIAMGLVTPEARLDLRALAADSYAQVWRNGAGTVVSSMTAGGVLYADGSQLRNMPVDGLGTHIATQDLDLSGFALKSAGGVTAAGQITAFSSVTVVGGAGVLAPRLWVAAGAEISSTTAAEYGGIYISTHVYLKNGAKFYGDASAMVGIPAPDNLGNHVLLQNLRLGSYWVSGDGANEGISVNSDGQVGVGINPASARFEVNDGDANALTSGVKFTNFACSGTDKLSTDASGNLICAADQAGSGTGNLVDNLSDTLAAGTDGGGRGMVNLGSLAVGRAVAEVRLDAQAAAPDTHIQYWRNSASVLVASMTAGGVLYADGSGLRNLSALGDDLGDHTASQQLDMAGNSIWNAAYITSLSPLTVRSSGTFTSDMGVWSAKLKLAEGVAFSSAGAANYGGVYLSTHVYLPAGAKYYGDGSGLTNIDAADHLGNHTATQDLDMAGYSVVAVSSLAANVLTTGGAALLADKPLSVNGDFAAGSGGVVSTISASGYLALANLTAQPGGAGAGSLYYNPDAFAGQGALYINLNGAFVPLATGTVAGGGGMTGVISDSDQFSGDGNGVGTKLTLKSSSVTLQGNEFNGPGQLVLLDAAGALPAVDGSALTGVSGVGDSFGSHTATKTVNLDGFMLVNASTIVAASGELGIVFSTGVAVGGNVLASGGAVFSGGPLLIGPGFPAASLHVSSAAGYAGDLVLVSTGVSTMFSVNGAGEVRAMKYYGDGSDLTGIAAGADNLGNHTAAQDINMMQFSVTNAGSVEVSSRMSVGLEAGLNPSVVAMVMDVIYEKDISDMNIGLGAIGLVFPSADKTSGETVIGGDFRGGIAPGDPDPNAYNFPAAIGVRASAWAHTAGTLGKAYGLYVQNAQSEGTVTSNVGVFVDVPDSTGTITENYGLFVRDQSTFGALSHNIWSGGANSLNYFEGTVQAEKVVAQQLLALPQRTKAQLLALVPASAGEVYYCSSGCTAKMIVVSTGTSAGNFATATGGSGW